jgi:hypothetical protein
VRDSLKQVAVCAHGSIMHYAQDRAGGKAEGQDSGERVRGTLFNSDHKD